MYPWILIYILSIHAFNRYDHMKNLLAPLFLLVALSSFGQTTSTTSATKTILPNLDTLVTYSTKTTTITSKVVYDTSVSTSVKYDTLKYKAPVINPATAVPGGLASRSVSYSNKSNFAITGLSFNGGGLSKDLITLNNCQNVHITMCRFSNTNGISVRLNNCSNITVDYCFFTMVNFGVMATSCTGTKVNFNQGLNLWAPVKYNNNFAHFVQYINCSGAGQQVNDNIFICQKGIAVHPHDIISIYQTSGTSASRFQIKRNKIKGGQVAGGWPNSGDTGTGLTAPDVSGSYYDITDNICVNCGVNGLIGVCSGSNLLYDNNISVCDDRTMKVSYDGFTFTGTKTNTIVSNNRARWIRPDGSYLGLWLGGGSTQVGVTFINNNWNDASLNSSIIPDSILTYK